MSVRVDVVVNRCARHLRGNTEAGTRLVAAARGRATVHETYSLAELDSVAAGLAARGTDAVILAGGDGSYMAGTTALHRAFGPKMPKVGFAPGGTVGTVARNWGMRGDEGAYAERIVRAAASERAKMTKRPTLQVEDEDGPCRVGFIFGAGLVANFFDAYYEAGSLGYSAAAGIVARVFVGSFYGGRFASRVLDPVPCRLIVDGEPIQSRAFSLVAASVVRDLGLHMRVLYRAAERVDRFHLVASPLRAPELGPQLPRVLLGRRLRGKDHVDRLADDAELSFTSGRGSYVLDGDVFSTSRVRVRPGPVLDYLSA